MEYSHSDRLEGFRNLYMTVVGETKSLYEAKEQWEFISDNLDDSYFWTALEDMYQNELVELNNFEISSSGEFDPDNFCMEEYDELNRVRVPKEWDLEAENISVFTDHFERHDQPGSDDYDLGYPICSLEVKRRIHKGDKSIEYLLQNDSESGEASLKLEVGFNIPNFSPEVEKIFLEYADNYLGRIERQEVDSLKKRSDTAREPAKKSPVT